MTLATDATRAGKMLHVKKTDNLGLIGNTVAAIYKQELKMDNNKHF